MREIKLLWSAVRQNNDWAPLNVTRKFLRLSTLLVRPHAHFKVRRALAMPRFARLILRFPQTPFKYLSNLYLIRGLTTSARAAALAHHYHYLHTNLSKNFTDGVLLGRVSIWGDIINNSHYGVSLNFSDKSKNEGELTVTLQANGVDIFCSGFTFVPGWIVGLDVASVLLITRLQGTKGGFQHIREATKTLHDVAPPAILFAVLRGIAEYLDIPNIVGVSAARQVEESASRDFTDAYDQFWISLGMTNSISNLYSLSLSSPEKPLQSIRQKYRGRTLIKRQLKSRIVAEVRQSIQRQQA